MINGHKSVDEVLNTSGYGYWSSQAKPVYFDPATWNIEKDGLIYTDKGFLSELKDYMIRAQYSCAINYSEFGMQVDNYVSLDVGREFIKTFTAGTNHG